MTIDECIELLESKYVASDIAKLQPKDRLQFWANITEFKRAKIQRSTFEPSNENDTEIIIKYESNQDDTHTDFQKSVDGTKKN